MIGTSLTRTPFFPKNSSCRRERERERVSVRLTKQLKTGHSSQGAVAVDSGAVVGPSYLVTHREERQNTLNSGAVDRHQNKKRMRFLKTPERENHSQAECLM